MSSILKVMAPVLEEVAVRLKSKSPKVFVTLDAIIIGIALSIKRLTVFDAVL